MLLKKHILEGIAEGRVSLAFRRWKRPTVKAGGSLRTVIGVLDIQSVEEIDESSITEREAQQAGCGSLEELLADLGTRSGDLYRIAFRFAGEDPRLELREPDELSETVFWQISNKLAGFDKRSSSGPWTRATLKLISKAPGKRAPELAEDLVPQKVAAIRAALKGQLVNVLITDSVTAEDLLEDA